MEKYFENIYFKRIYFLIVWIMFGLFGAFFITFSVNGKTKFIFFALVMLWIACMMYFITELKSYLIQLFFFITLWLFLFSRPMIDYIQTLSTSNSSLSCMKSMNSAVSGLSSWYILRAPAISSS